jgi:glucose-6-phosphate 1-dehydrogenase
MEVGVVNMFVSDDLGSMFGTAYSITKMSTKTAVDYITTIPQFQDLKKVDDPKVKAFIYEFDYIESEVNSKVKSDDYKKLYANLDSVSLKNQILNTISKIPLIIIINQYFAIIMGLFIVSFVQIYFAIFFSLIGLLYVYLLDKLLVKKNEN